VIGFLLAGAAMAQTTGGPAPNAGPRVLSQLLMVLLLVAIFYVLLIRPQQRRQKAVQEMLKNIKNGDRVLTSGGIYGQVLGIKDEIVVLKISEDVKVEVAKSAIQGVVPK
jgi:preprotein translocase subunit YajC